MIEDDVTVEETTEMTNEEMFESTGLVKDTHNIEMQADNIYLVLTREDQSEADTEQDFSSVGLALLTKDGGHPELTAFAYGIFELLHSDPEIILAAGYEFLARKAGFQEGPSTIN